MRRMRKVTNCDQKSPKQTIVLSIVAFVILFQISFIVGHRGNSKRKMELENQFDSARNEKQSHEDMKLNFETNSDEQSIEKSHLDHMVDHNAKTMKHSKSEKQSEQETGHGERSFPLTNITCDELMQGPSSIYKDGSFLTNRTTRIVWKKRSDGSRELTLPYTCHLKRYTADEAGICLKNKNLFFVGDSLTRYQFLSLAYFLEYKKWPMRFQAGLQPCLDHIDEDGNPSCSKTEEPSVCAVGDWVDFGGWNYFFQSIGGGTDGGVFNGRMESQSVRSSNRNISKVDTMQYVSSTEYGEGRGHTILSVYTESGSTGMEPFHGFNFMGCGYNATCTYTPERYNQNKKRLKANDFDWAYPNIMSGFGPNGTDFHAQHQNTNYIFYNRGIWGGIQIEKAKKMMSAIYQMIGGDLGRKVSNNRCFFRSTTGSSKSKRLDNLEYGPVRNVVYNSGCEYFDVAHVTAEFSKINKKNSEHRNIFWEGSHYVPWVYEELNNLLLNVLCNTHVSLRNLTVPMIT